MKIVKFYAENVKRLKTVEIEPSGAVVRITGENGNGKTSILDAIWWALKGERVIQGQPIRRGEDEALIRLDLGDIIVKRKFILRAEGNTTTTLSVEAANGAKFSSPQKMLDDLLGALTFDPLAFSRMDSKEQLKEVRAIVKLDVDIDALDLQNAADFSKRTELTRAIKALTAQASAITFPPGLPEGKVDVSALNDQMEAAAKHNGEIETRKNNRAAVAAGITDLRERAAKARENAAMFERQAAEYEAKAAEDEKRLAEAPPLPEPINTAEVRMALDAAIVTNAGIVERDRGRKIAAEAAEKQKEADALTKAMEKREKQKVAAIAAAKMPIEGLAFAAGGVIYNGLPLEQASSAEQLRISTAIAMAANPSLRVLRIKDGSLLDEKSMTLLAEMANTNDFQLWIESVDSSGKIGVVIKDGEVAAVNEAAE